ncbi:MAG TPA: sigma-70 family RNA polymerase sigma factor [Thermoanaerobaculia bacterium]|nr:sigma-70 family RNA polymerase sigma factor [Thermoanaerobaculia bacterium]
MDFFRFDDDYVRRLREGDRETSEHFASYFRELLLIKLRRRVSRRDAIEDLIQETFVRVLARLSELQEPAKLGPYVNSVANHVLLEWYRANPITPAGDAPPPDAVDPGDVESELIDEETRRRVRETLNELPRRDRELLRDVLEEKTPAEICRARGIEANYLRVLLYRARKKFETKFLHRKNDRSRVDETSGG